MKYAHKPFDIRRRPPISSNAENLKSRVAQTLFGFQRFLRLAREGLRHPAARHGHRLDVSAGLRPGRLSDSPRWRVESSSRGLADVDATACLGPSDAGSAAPRQRRPDLPCWGIDPWRLVPMLRSPIGSSPIERYRPATSFLPQSLTSCWHL